MDDLEDFDEEEMGKFPPWIDHSEFLQDVAEVLVKYQLTVGHFYDGLGVDVYADNDEYRRVVINTLAELRQEMTLKKRKGEL